MKNYTNTFAAIIIGIWMGNIYFWATYTPPKSIRQIEAEYYSKCKWVRKPEAEIKEIRRLRKLNDSSSHSYPWCKAYTYYLEEYDRVCP